jgi:hypothetical protein
VSSARVTCRRCGVLTRSVNHYGMLVSLSLRFLSRYRGFFMYVSFSRVVLGMIDNIGNLTVMILTFTCLTKCHCPVFHGTLAASTDVMLDQKGGSLRQKNVAGRT